MDLPLGDILRSFIKSGPIRKILDAVKGITISKGGTTIRLNEGQGPARPGESHLDNKPHRPGPLR